MSKITKNQRINQIADQLARQQGVVSKLTIMVKEQNEAILMLEKLTDEKLRDQPEPQLKQLDQSVFKNMHERWRFAAIDADGSAHRFNKLVDFFRGEFVYEGDDSKEFKFSLIGKGYDASNWQNSLIERDTAKELQEVDLSSELTGSELCKAMLARGDKWVVCRLADTSDKDALNNGRPVLVTKFDGDFYHKEADQYWKYAVPINNQGEPLTASEVGL